MARDGGAVAARRLALTYGDALPDAYCDRYPADDAALDVGRVRFRGEGSPGGHNGLKSVDCNL